jgi:hypothetical protein
MSEGEKKARPVQGGRSGYAVKSEKIIFSACCQEQFTYRISFGR